MSWPHGRAASGWSVHAAAHRSLANLQEYAFFFGCRAALPPVADIGTAARAYVGGRATKEGGWFATELKSLQQYPIESLTAPGVCG